MKKLIVAMSVLMVASFNAQANMDLAKSKNCLACHAPERKLVGPSFKEIAERYKDDKSAESKLITKTMRGSSGAWGLVPMPANPQVSETEAKQLVEWILSGQK